MGGRPGRPCGCIISKPGTRGEHMRYARMRAGMSQTKLAEKSGVSKQAICYAESEHGVPKLDTVEMLADALGISIDEYVGHKVEVRR